MPIIYDCWVAAVERSDLHDAPTGGEPSVPKNIVICCDGTGNEIEANLSNVLKLFRILKKSRDQIVFYDTGIGTLSRGGAWSRLRDKSKTVFGLATGQGLDDNILDAYRFLMDSYEDGDRVYLFGFSRGAYTVRALAGLINLVGLLERPQANLCDHALGTYKKAAGKDDFRIAWRFQSISGARRIPIRFIGVWDTVSSVLVPRRDRLYIPSRQMLPYTATNPLVEAFRQAIAIDERRSMFRLNRWKDPQDYKPNPFDTKNPPVAQDIKQVWFAGVHSDVGGGYPEAESGLAKLPLRWMIDEAKAHGLLVSTQMYNHLVLGHARKDGTRAYVKPDPAAKAHRSLGIGWMPLELLPKPRKFREWSSRPSLLGLYLPLAEPRLIPEGALIHRSVLERQEQVPDYRPVNLPQSYTIEPS